MMDRKKDIKIIGTITLLTTIGVFATVLGLNPVTGKAEETSTTVVKAEVRERPVTEKYVIPTTTTTAPPTTTTTAPPTTTTTVKPYVAPTTTVKPTQTTTGAPAVQGSIQQIIIDAANKYGVNSNYLLSVARCESNFNTQASNNGMYNGLFQYHSGTWQSFSAKAGYGGASIWDGSAQANVTAWAFANGLSSHWACA